MPVHDNYSRGCQLCQRGTWLCIFLTYLCNTDCAFCPAPYKDDRIISPFGDDPDIILDYMSKYKQFEGLSFSGGECFLVFERLYDWLSFFNKRIPDMYYWVYTNGVAVNNNKLECLKQAGLDEIRFNIAATNYNSPSILENIALAAQIIKNVAVEIPSIPSDYEKITEVLELLDQYNVKFLNLHEFIITPNHMHHYPDEIGTFLLNKEVNLHYHIGSTANSKRIKNYCQRKKLKIKVNICTLNKKETQMYYRRLVMGNIFKKEYDLLTLDGFLETYFVFPGTLELENVRIFLKNNLEFVEKYFIHPEILSQKKIALDNMFVAKLTYLPPLGFNEKRRIYKVEVIQYNT